MAQTGYDVLTFQINADSKEANKSIKGLSNNLNKLNESAKNLDTRRLGEVKGLLLNIAKIDFSNVSKGLQDVVSAFKYFQSKTAQTKSPIFSMFDKGNKNSLFSFDKQVSSYTKMLNDINYDFSGASVDTGVKEKTPLASSEIDKAKELRDTLKEINLTSKQINVVFSALGMQLNSFGDEQIKAVEEALKKAGKSSEDITIVIKKLRKEMSDLDKGVGQAGRSFAKMFKNILKYRVVRKVIQTIFQEITNAFQELANKDDGFNQALGEIKSAISYIARVLVSILAPIIKAIAPIITMIAQALGEIGNAFASDLAGSLGQDQVAEAQENIESYNDSLKKTKTLTAGIDELNVFNAQDNSGNFEMKEVSEMSGGLGSLINTIKEVLQPFLSKIVPMITELLGKIMKHIEKIAPVIEKIINLIMQLVDGTLDKIFSSLSSFIDLIGEIVGLVGDIVSDVVEVLQPVIDIIAIVINIVNELLGSIFEALGGIIGVVKNIVNVVNAIIVPVLKFIFTVIATILYVCEAIIMTIKDIFTFNWGNIGRDWDIEGKVNDLWKRLGSTNVSATKYSGQFATGGFPEDGFFYANHTELVGKFDNGKTAVANNEQIIAGIERGVYNAMVQANQDGTQKPIVIQIDGYNLAQVITDRQDNFGQPSVIGSKLAYGK